MRKPKYKFTVRNRTMAEQFSICGNFVDRVSTLPLGQRRHVRLGELQTLRAAAESSDRQVRQLQVALKAAVSKRKKNLKAYREATQYAALGASLDAGGEVELRAAGLDVERRKSPIGLADAPTHLRVVPVRGEATGAIGLRWKRPVRRCIFLLEYTTDLNGKKGWKKFCGSNAARCIIRDLQPGLLYYVRVAAQNTAGVGPWAYIQARAGH